MTERTMTGRAGTGDLGTRSMTRGQPATRRRAASRSRAWRSHARGEVCDERGVVATELVLLTPLLIVLLLFVVALGRLAGARINVDGAAAQAARAASIAATPGEATAAAEQTAEGALGSDHVSCARLTVSTDTARFAPGGSVTVTISCSVALSDLTGLALPVSEQVASTATSVIDTYRSAPAP
jgi:Flp pilus assembly protein TadG